jgi:hypothetical protein
MITWMYYPKSSQADNLVRDVVKAFESAEDLIDSAKNNLDSNGVLAQVAQGLRSLGFVVESGKAKADRISVPVLFGLNGRPEKSFDADAYHPAGGFVVEVEAGRGVVNNQFLKDLFQACLMHDVFYLAIAVRTNYRGVNDFEKVCRFMDSLFSSRRLELPLRGILIIGY